METNLSKISRDLVQETVDQEAELAVDLVAGAAVQEAELHHQVEAPVTQAAVALTAVPVAAGKVETVSFLLAASKESECIEYS